MQVGGRAKNVVGRCAGEGGVERPNVGRRRGNKLRCKDSRDQLGRAAHAGELRGAAEEQLVFDDRAADDAAELIAGVDAAGDSILGVRNGVGGGGREAIVFPQAAVEGVGAGHRSDSDDTAGGAAILRREIVGDDAIFLHGIEEDRDADHIIKDGDILNAVEKDLRTRGARAVQAEVDAVGGVVLICVVGSAGVP